jgi:6-phosphofructokinase 2
VCRILSRLGADASALWLSGGYTGKELDDLLAQLEVTGESVEMPGAVRHSIYVAENAGDEEYRFVLPGPDIDQEQIDAVGEKLSALEDVEYLVLSGSLPRGAPEDSYRQLARHAEQARVVVDTSGPALGQAIEDGALLIKPNLRELADLTGSDNLDSARRIEAAARQLVDRRGVEHVLVSLGAGGAQLVSAGESFRMHAPTVKVQSTVGAGDSMVAGTVFGFSKGWSAQEALRLGVAAGSAAVTTPGTDLCRSEDVWRLHEEMSP